MVYTDGSKTWWSWWTIVYLLTRLLLTVKYILHGGFLPHMWQTFFHNSQRNVWNLWKVVHSCKFSPIYQRYTFVSVSKCTFVKSIPNWAVCRFSKEDLDSERLKRLKAVPRNFPWTYLCLLGQLDCNLVNKRLSFRSLSFSRFLKASHLRNNYLQIKALWT